jgi:hypothetical protein
VLLLKSWNLKWNNDWGNKYVYVGLVIMILIMVQTPSFEKTMSIRWQEKLRVGVGSTSTSHTQADLSSVTHCIKMFLYIHCHGHIAKGGYPLSKWVGYTHIKKHIQLKEGKNLVEFKTWWKKLLKTIKIFGSKLCYESCTYPKARTWQHVGLVCIKHFLKEHAKKVCDSASILRWSHEIKPLVD